MNGKTKKNQKVSLPYLDTRRDLLECHQISPRIQIGRLFFKHWRLMYRITKSGIWSEGSPASIDYLMEHGY